MNYSALYPALHSAYRLFCRDGTHSVDMHTLVKVGLVLCSGPLQLDEEKGYYSSHIAFAGETDVPIDDSQLDAVVLAWNAYAEERPRKVNARDLLDKRDINMYRGLGIADAYDLAKNMVEHRSVATMEMTMGYLYERLLEELGPRKVTRNEKKRPGYRGVDFVHDRPSDLSVINLKAGLSTSNGDITAATRRNLIDAKEFWETHRGTDDNPLAQMDRDVVMVKAVARGGRRKVITEDGILWIVGESMWEHFGAGEGFLRRLSQALGRNPLDFPRYEKEKDRAKERVFEYLRQRRFVDSQGTLDWGLLTARFP